jgi:hypothetical protein
MGRLTADFTNGLFSYPLSGTTVGWEVARNDLGSGHEVNAKRSSETGLIAGAVHLMWDDFQDDCGYWLPAWGTLEGLARLFQPIDLGLISWRVHLNDGCGHLQSMSYLRD